jgi:hypothetical protein
VPKRGQFECALQPAIHLHSLEEVQRFASMDCTVFDESPNALVKLFLAHGGGREREK